MTHVHCELDLDNSTVKIYSGNTFVGTATGKSTHDMDLMLFSNRDGISTISWNDLLIVADNFEQMREMIDNRK
jgi:hypothetical protein